MPLNPSSEFVGACPMCGTGLRRDRYSNALGGILACPLGDYSIQEEEFNRIWDKYSFAGMEIAPANAEALLKELQEANLNKKEKGNDNQSSI